MKNRIYIFFLLCFYCSDSNCLQAKIGNATTSQSALAFSEGFLRNCHEIYEHCKRLERRILNKSCEALEIPTELEDFYPCITTDYNDPLNLACLLTEWMVTTALHRIKFVNDKLNGLCFYAPVYKPMMYFLLSAYVFSKYKVENVAEFVGAINGRLPTVNAVIKKLVECDGDNVVLKNMSLAFDVNERVYFQGGQKEQQDLEKNIETVSKLFKHNKINESVKDFEDVFECFTRVVFLPWSFVKKQVSE